MMERSKSVQDYKMSKGVKRCKNNLKLKKGYIGGEKECNSSNEGWKGKSRENENTSDQLGVKKRFTNISSNKTEANASLKAEGLPGGQASFLREKVDPETANYFYRIANLLENNEIDLEERSVICGNALEETRGKELELSTDVIISRTLQTLLEGCDSDQLCSFLLNSSNVFAYIATDKCGSHVAETALRSLSTHAQDQFTHSTVEDILMKICEAVALYSVDVMCSPYGSHVLRSLICICKGLPMDVLDEYHNTKSFSSLAERLNPQARGKKPHQPEHGFPDTFKFFVMEILRHSKDHVATLCVNKYSSLVMQTLLKLLVGENELLLHAILVLLGCTDEHVSEGCLIENTKVLDILNLLEDTASSHLLEVILEVAPENLYDEILTKVFRGSLSKISTHRCGNFVVQALLSSAKSGDQVNMIWAELHLQLKHLLEMGKSGVIASLLAACERLQTHGLECCQILANAVCLSSDFPSSIVPHILYLESYFSCKDVSNWQCPVGEKMHTLGCLMLQTIFRYPKKFIQPYVRSVLSMDADLIVQMANDTGGGRVLESFLCSDLSAKQKLKVITKLQSHFGELSMQPSGSFTVERCFDASDLSLKETIASELLAVRGELSKMKHGPYILKKLDVDDLDARPEQWRRRQATKEITYKEFYATFGSDSKQEDKNTHAFPMNKTKRNKKKIREDTQEPDVSPVLTSVGLELPGLKNSMAKLGFPDPKHGRKRKIAAGATTGSEPSRQASHVDRSSVMLGMKSGKGRSSVADLADLATKKTLTAAEIQSLFKGTTKKAKRN